jgi:pimeloyl-ACP methyl ester carboxylesterase
MLLIVLPGFGMHAEDFVSQGFIAEARRRAPTTDILVAEPDLDLYLNGAVAGHLTRLVATQCAAGYARLWIGGISLGCFGALLAASQCDAVEGLILLAPFLGTPGLIAEIEEAGGLRAWNPGEIAEHDLERRLLAWLACRAQNAGDKPFIHLGYGVSDRFAAASRLLAAILPPGRSHVLDGAHDWPCWGRLWQSLLAADPFSVAGQAECP